MSTRGQNLGRQTDMLTAAGCRRIFADKKSGRTAQQPELEACHAFLTAGDTLVVPDLARYGRSLKDLVTMVGELGRRDIGFTSLFIRELIVIGTHEGLAAARARGRTGGRPTVADAELLKAARDLLPDPGRSVASIARLLGVSVGTLYNHIPDLQELRAASKPPEINAAQIQR